MCIFIRYYFPIVLLIFMPTKSIFTAATTVYSPIEYATEHVKENLDINGPKAEQELCGTPHTALW